MDSRGEFKKNLADTNQRLIKTDPRTLKIRAVTSVVSKVALLVAFGTCFFTRNLVNQASEQIVQFQKLTTIKELNSLGKHSSLVYSKATLSGHTSNVNSLAFSPDGRTLASASNDKTIKLWDLQTKREIGTFTGHSSNVWIVAFSPDGRTLASTSDKTIKLWDLQTKKELATFTGHNKDVTGLAFSPDGQILASASLDSTLKLWKVLSQKESSHKSIPMVEDFFSRLWDIQSQNSIASLEEVSPYLGGFSPDGQTLIVDRGRGTQIVMWDWRRNKKTTSTLTGGKSWRSIAVSPDGKNVALRGRKELSLGDLQSKKVTPIFTNNSCGDRIDRVLVFSPNGKMFASATGNYRDITIRLWDVQSQKQTGNLLIGRGDLYNLVFSPNGKMLALATGHDITLTPIDSSDY